ncbi:MAG: hypothetical protein FJY65_06160 [Calditrichaeota bacterium]|nr:hypothetical protein [Calditrichota bacterium]
MKDRPNESVSLKCPFCGWPAFMQKVTECHYRYINNEAKYSEYEFPKYTEEISDSIICEKCLKDCSDIFKGITLESDD